MAKTNIAMKKKNYTCLALILMGFYLATVPANAQQDKNKDKKENVFKKGKVIFKKIKSFTTDAPSADETDSRPEPAYGEDYGSDRPPPKRKLTPPDVNDQLANARDALHDDNLAEARFFVRQAIMGIELEMGYDILASMPEKVLTYEADKSQDDVYSSGAGFAGMAVSREYPGSDYGPIEAAVGNNSSIYTMVGIEAQYATQGDYQGDVNSKVIRYKDNKAYIKVDDYSGYELMIPFGQSSVFVLKCPPCESEDELLQVADLFDIDLFKKLLGEQ